MDEQTGKASKFPVTVGLFEIPSPTQVRRSSKLPGLTTSSAGASLGWSKEKSQEGLDKRSRILKRQVMPGIRDFHNAARGYGPRHGIGTFGAQAIRAADDERGAADLGECCPLGTGSGTKPTLPCGGLQARILAAKPFAILVLPQPMAYVVPV
jgi:hypothetical protein